MTLRQKDRRQSEGQTKRKKARRKGKSVIIMIQAPEIAVAKRK